MWSTKLISLLLFRARHNKNFEEFHLASNVDGIGAFDDICIRAKLKASDRPVALFIQAEHREGDDAQTLNNKNDWDKYFHSYLKIRRAFKLENWDVIFKGTFDETECFFVLYTNAKGDVKNVVAESELIHNIDALLATDDETASQIPYSNENIDLICKLALEEQVTSLAVRMAQLYCGEVDYNKILDDELVSRYHVILAQKVIDVSDVQPGEYREATFRKSLFDNNEEFVKSFKDALSIEILKRRTVTDETIQNLINSNNYSTLIYRLYGNVIMYNNKNGMLEFIDKDTPENLKKRLAKVNVSKSDIDETIHRAAKNILTSSCNSHLFKVPVAFGNKDLTISGDDKKIKTRLDHLRLILHSILERSHPSNIVTIDESLGKAFLQLNGGIAGAVGNILVLDENTGLMKFTDDCNLLEDNAKNLLTKLKDKNPNLHKYRFEVNITNFPKLSYSYGEYEKCLANDFLNKLLLYTNQADENRAEDILINEIEDLQCSKGENSQVTSYAKFLTIHDYVQKWCNLRGNGTYLTKEDDIFHITSVKIVQAQISSLKLIYRNKVKTIDYKFNENALNSLRLQEPLSSTLVVTDISVITLAKVVQCLKNKDFAVLDLEYILNLSKDDCKALCTELKDSKKDKILIFVCDSIPNYTNRRKIFKKVLKAIREKVVVIITNQELKSCIKRKFSKAFNFFKVIFGNPFKLVNDEITNLSNLSEESQTNILNKATVIFQGKETALNLIVDEESMAFLKGDVLNKIICREPIVIGQSLTNSNYEEIKHLYVNRCLIQNGIKFGERGGEVVETLTDIKQDDVVLVTALPGMGKSTLLTHLSLKTQVDERRVWIVRINLVDYSREFNMWQENKTTIDTLETLNFMCQVILGEEKLKANTPTFTLKESDSSEVELNNYVGDQMTEFELELFLHFYNKGRIIFIFDGFDEICPHYANEVLQLLKTVRSYPKQHKMWIASRSYNEIQTILKREFKVLYELEYFSNNEVNTYLNKFWDSNLILQDFNIKQLKNVHNFIEFMKDSLRSRTVSKIHNLPLLEIYFNVLNYITNKIRLSSIPLWNEMKWELKDGPGAYNHLAYTQMKFNGGPGDTKTMYTFLGTPLHLHIVAEYFLNEIKQVSKECNEWNLDINTFTIYERFLERKLKTIRFQEKNKIDIFRSDNISTYEKEQAKFITKHKRLAVYTIFHKYNSILLSEGELTDVENMIKVIKQGGEKSGLIYSVTSVNFPIFVHRTFAEYFAVTYICDLLKNTKCSEKRQTLIRFMLNEIIFKSSANVRSIFDSKLLLDDALLSVLKRNGIVILNLLSEQAKRNIEFEICYSDFEIEVIDSSFNRALLDNLDNLVSLFLSILQMHLNEDNVDDFIDIIRESLVFGIINAEKYKPFIIFALDNVRRLKPSCFNFMFHIFNFDIITNYLALSNEDIFGIITWGKIYT